MNKDSMEKFTNLVLQLTKEYVESGGSISAEFSTNTSDIVEKLDILHKNGVNERGMVADWIMYPCDTCAGHDKTAPMHIELVSGHPERLVCWDW